MKLSLRRPPRVVLLGLLVLAAIVAGGLLTAALQPTSSSASGLAPVPTTGFPSGPGVAGIFTERCAFSHEAADDPILVPGRPGRAMHHDFFGNVTTGASSTARSLRGGATSCATSADSSAYWVPVLYQHGVPVTPISALIYWRRPLRAAAAVHPVPPGLQMIAGDETATRPQGVDVVAWSCAREPITAPSAVRTPTPHACPPATRLKLTVTFPSCWNGRTLSARAQTNVAYLLPGRAGCPASHPVQIPQIVFHVIYPISSASGLTLSMSPTMRGSVDTAHADFINAWRQPILERDVRACIATSTRCGPVTGPQAIPRGPVTANG